MTDDATQQDTRQDGDRLTVGEAAARLNVTPDAIRARLRRGSLEGGKDGEQWFVILPADDARDTRQDADATATGRDTTPATDDRLIDQLRSEVDYLRSELTAAREQAARERERADVLQREALQRLEALTAGPIGTPEPPGSPESVDTVQQGSGHGQDADRAPAGALSRLWRWIRGG